jgi:hypothetical protein
MGFFILEEMIKSSAPSGDEEKNQPQSTQRPQSLSLAKIRNTNRFINMDPSFPFDPPGM